MNQSITTTKIKLPEDACKVAKNWYNGQASTEQAWKNCKEPAWMCWILFRLKHPKKLESLKVIKNFAAAAANAAYAADSAANADAAAANAAANAAAKEKLACAIREKIPTWKID